MSELTFDEDEWEKPTEQMSNEEYHASSTLGASNLKDILKNPFAFARGFRMKQTQAMVIGSAVHCKVLEPHLFDQEYALKDKKSLGDALGGFGKTKLSADEYETVKKCTETIKEHVNMFFQNGVAEQAFFSEINGIAVKCKPDYYIESIGLVVDLKVVADASPDGFAKAVAKFGYYLQEAHYRSVLKSCGKPVDKFLFVAIEKEAPYMIGLYTLNPTDVLLGEEHIAKAMDIYKRIDQYKKPIYTDPTDSTQLIQVLTMPTWVHYQYNQ